MRFALLIAPLALLIDGCAYHRLATKVENPGSTAYHPVKSEAYGWGVSEQTSRADKCETNLLSEVRVKTSFGQSLLTVLSLGLYQPARIEYRCAKNPTGVGEIEE